MPNFKVKVTITAEFSYEIEVDERDERRAEDYAISRGNMMKSLPEDFQVDSGYCTYETEAEQLTAVCPRCSEEHKVSTHGNCGYSIVDGRLVWNPDIEWWGEDQDYCAACGLLEAASAS